MEMTDEMLLERGFHEFASGSLVSPGEERVLFEYIGNMIAKTKR